MNAPKLRFKEFNDEWEKINLKSIFNYYSTNSLSREQLSNDGILKNIHYGDIHKKFSTIVDVNSDVGSFIKDLNYNNKNELCKNYDLIFADASEDYEGIGKAIELINVDFNTISGLHTILARDTQNSFAPKFKGYYFNSPVIHNQIRILANGFKVYGISKETINKLNVNIPSKNEQIKIANTLELLDQKIELQTKKIEDIKLFKKGLINKLFENINSNIKIKDVASLKNGYSFKNELYDINGKYNILTISNVTGDMYISKSFKNKYKEMPNDIQDHQILKENDILVSLTGNVGRVSLNTGTNNLLNQRVGLLEAKENINEKFIFYMLNNIKFENKMISKGQGAAQLNISKNDIENYIIPYPIEEEQIKIVNILDLYFKKIYLEKEKLNALNELKKGLMQNMFV